MNVVCESAGLRSYNRYDRAKAKVHQGQGKSRCAQYTSERLVRKMAEADVSVNQCVENVNEKNINKILEDKVMISIRELHRRKRRADTDSIITETVDMNPEKVKSLLNKLCEDRILKITNRSGLESYRFIDNEDYKQNTVTTVAEKTPEPDFLEKSGNISENNFLEHEIQCAKSFDTLHELTKVIQDLKEYVAYEVNKLRKVTSQDLVDQLREENKFLKNELKEYKVLVKDILEHNTRRNQSSETVYNKNEWKNVSSGPSRFVTRDRKSSEIILSNKYNDLINETTFHNHNDNNENNNNIDFSIRRPSVSVKPNKQTVINKRPNPVINQHPEREQYFKKEPIKNLSSRKKIRILADSIPNGIRVREFNKFISDGYARFKCFPGASVSHLNYYSNPTLEDDSPDLVVIHAGINNLLSADLNNASDVEIAEELIKVGQKCVDHGVQKVFISSITRSRPWLQQSRMIGL